MSVIYPRAVRIMHNARPPEVFVALRSLLAEYEVSASLWLADYRQSVLRAVDDPATSIPELPVQGSWQGRVFASGRAATHDEAGGGGRVALPVTHRGARVGVLEVWSDGPLSDDVIGELSDVAAALGHEIAVASEVSDHFEHRVSGINAVNRRQPTCPPPPMLCEIPTVGHRTALHPDRIALDRWGPTALDSRAATWDGSLV